MPKSEEPPIGVEPSRLWEERRIGDLAAAITRYVDSGRVDSPEVWGWANEIVERLEGFKDGES